MSAIRENRSSLILIADDDQFMLEALAATLESCDYRVMTAVDGKEAVTLFKAYSPDLVLLDGVMPVMGGLQTCQLIKSHPLGEETPVIMITALDGEDHVNAAFEAGAQEYIAKPINWAVLLQRVRLLLDQKFTHKEVRSHRDRLNAEKLFIEEIITRMRDSLWYNPTHLKTLLNPVETMCGDMILSALRPDKTQHVLLGDFTGHGLPAAIGGPVTSDIFYAMTRKGFSGQEILTEINQKLYQKTPSGMFMAAGFLELNREKNRLTVWNCSLPDILIFRDEALVERVTSSHFARGILNQPDKPGTQINVRPGDRIFAYTDGFVEEKNSEEEMLGPEKFEKKISEMIQHHAPLDTLKKALDDYRSGREQSDDETMIELTC
ncbi:MAG: fused response regulator/phosphatase [Magnetococcales bacterium]|nr:fused response regulator/phosphatase [Magnetococcales bacterium]